MDYVSDMTAVATGFADNARTSRLEAGVKNVPHSEAEIQKAADDFEAFFLHYMIKTMRKAVQKSDLFNRSRGEEVFQDYFDREIAGIMAGEQDFGIGRMVRASLEERVENAPAEALNRLNARRAYGAGATEAACSAIK